LDVPRLKRIEKRQLSNHLANMKNSRFRHTPRPFAPKWIPLWAALIGVLGQIAIAILGKT
jgi:hypothetical protein